MNLVYFHTHNKSWCLLKDNQVHFLSAGVTLYNVSFIVIPEIRNDILKRIGLEVPQYEAMDPYPHAFMVSGFLNHQTLFPKEREVIKREVIYSFSDGIFCYQDTKDAITWSEYVLLTSDFKIYV